MQIADKKVSTSRPPSIRTHIDLHDRSLKNAEGAQRIITVLRASKNVRHLILGHNPLGDDGVRTLMEFLVSESGRRLPIEELSLNVTEMGDDGLEAIADYLNGNQVLHSLHLQNVSLNMAS